ncbi:SRPBCC family protein [Devosia sediminis]|uniref:SRPBCC domain-containing protein n=1 Tax=Devosia sediminis TaxID=2798801 RepID=A0A934IW60_9HYPH|nr:SRPBCC domain-containing protein [Devosia sediminis]MBJ3783320.1 SRPBCC domain-containing protein [Devosia sediminis]
MTSATETRTVTVEREIAQPAAKIWKALTTSHLMSEWLMNNDFRPEVGHKFKLRGDWGGVMDCEVLAIEPERSLSYTWNFANDDPLYALQSTVTYTLTPTAAGTHLRVEQSGFHPNQKQAYGGAHAGWKGFLAKLEEVAGKQA